MVEWLIYDEETKAIITSNDGLAPVWRQAIIWTNASLWSIEHLETSFSKILIKIQPFSYTKIHLIMMYV